MPLYLHLSIHFGLALLAGYLVGRHFKKNVLGLIAGLLGGFLIDLDHVLEYLLVFNWHFNLGYFLEGREFLAADKIYVWFHAWEYVPLLVLLAIVFKKYKALETFLFALALAASVHLLSDSAINQYPLEYYSLIHRQEVNFSAEKLLSPEEYAKNQELKKALGL